jgi:hypothetical protein
MKPPKKLEIMLLKIELQNGLKKDIEFQMLERIGRN